MARSLSTTAREAINAEETGEVFLILLTVGADLLDPPIRVVQNTEDIVSRGNTYIGMGFEIDLPVDDEEQVTDVQLSIQNVDRQIVAAIREVSEPVDIVMEVIVASDPDTVEAGPFEFVVTAADYDAELVRARVSDPYEELNQEFPSGAFTPSLFPGLFS